MTSRRRHYDAIILGGGPAGLSAALILGRCRRRVLVCDAGRPRNAASRALHGFLTRDGIAPAELLRIARRQLARYRVELVRGKAVGARRTDGGFDVAAGSPRRARSRRTGSREPEFPVSTSPATPRTTCSSRSSPRRRARKRPSRSTAFCRRKRDWAPIR